LKVGNDRGPGARVVEKNAFKTSSQPANNFDYFELRNCFGFLVSDFGFRVEASTENVKEPSKPHRARQLNWFSIAVVIGRRFFLFFGGAGAAKRPAPARTSTSDKRSSPQRRRKTKRRRIRAWSVL
jgi:hypothetical protein